MPVRSASRPPSSALHLTPTHSLACFGLGQVAYVQAMGTSAAAPLTAGAAALVRAAHPTWDAATVVAALRTSATVLPGLSVPQVNAATAVGPADDHSDPIPSKPVAF